MMSQRDLLRRFGGRITAAEMESAIEEMVAEEWLFTRKVTRQTGGRPSTMIGYVGMHDQGDDQ